MKRVLLVSEARRAGGAELYLERLAVALPGWSAGIALPERPSLLAWRRRLEAAGIPVLPFTPTVAGWRRLAVRARGEATLVHVNLPSTYDGACGALPAVLAAVSGKPVVTSEHLVHLERSRRRRWLKLRTASLVRAVLVTSAAGKRALAGEGIPAGRIAVVLNGVPDPGGPFPFPPEDGSLVVSTLVALEPRKQVDLLLRAIAGCGARVRLEIGGDGPCRESLEALARELGLGDRVRFHGTVADAAAFLARSHVVALPSRLEGMPLVLLDAFACGRGVLASDLPGMEEIVAEGSGLLLSREDPGPWTKALEGAAGERSRARAWGALARERFERSFTLERSAVATARFYERVLSGDPVDA